MAETNQHPTDEEYQKVVVYGAGIENANGEYRLVGRGDGDSPTYEKEGRGDVATSSIKCCGGTWTIYTNGKACYQSNECPSVSPPSRLWWCVGSESNVLESLPPPVLVFDNKTMLDWRQEPSESFSDYKILIAGGGNDNLTEYHVHKLIIANGSAYFHNLLNHNFIEGEENASLIELNEQMAAVFPHLLDYMYWMFSDQGRVGQVQVPLPATHVSLYKLADYFEVPHLLRDLNLHQIYDKRGFVWEYLIPAQAQGVQQVIDVALEYCAPLLWKLGHRQDIKLVTRNMTTPTLSILIQHPKENRKKLESDLQASRLLAAFCEEHEIDADTFSTLTDASVMQSISPCAAWPLLKKESELIGRDTILTDLQRRCIKSLSENFVKLQFSDMEAIASQPLLFREAFFNAVQQHVRESSQVSDPDE
ncbi:hypothetical protein MPSEU_000693700 [Mayamaea pseudoterrestris]|nr:hypothetical protein MPSEU_000693700 [Mayamaea pseudoterrestris]